MPTLSDLKFYDKTLNVDLDIFSDSIFYKKTYLSLKDLKFNHKNMFFYDAKVYDKNYLNFLSYQVYPTKNNVDFFKIKNQKREFPSKPKLLNYKLFLDQQLTSFENFYLKNELFVADSFEYRHPADENLEFFTSDKFFSKRVEEMKHYFKVRLPSFGDIIRKKYMIRLWRRQVRDFMLIHR